MANWSHGIQSIALELLEIFKMAVIVEVWPRNYDIAVLGIIVMIPFSPLFTMRFRNPFRLYLSSSCSISKRHSTYFGFNSYVTRSTCFLSPPNPSPDRHLIILPIVLRFDTSIHKIQEHPILRLLKPFPPPCWSSMSKSPFLNHVL